MAFIHFHRIACRRGKPIGMAMDRMGVDPIPHEQAPLTILEHWP
jgi:hypothetical protein